MLLLLVRIKEPNLCLLSMVRALQVSVPREWSSGLRTVCWPLFSLRQPRKVGEFEFFSLVEVVEEYASIYLLE